MKKLELHQMECLEGGFDWPAFGGAMAFTTICTFVGIAAATATAGVGIVAGFACSAMFAGLAASK